jgi:hypothetical protein
VNHREYHPVDEPGCIGCKVLSVSIAAAALEVKGAEVRKIDTKEKVLDKDLGAYKRLRDNGLQPRSVDGSADVERHVTSQFDIDLGRVVKPEHKTQVMEGMEMARDLGLRP